MTEVQARPSLLYTGQDVLAQAKTGSGKTLAFSFQPLSCYYLYLLKPVMGLGLLLCPNTRISPTDLWGGQGIITVSFIHTRMLWEEANRKTEVDRLQKGVNLLVGTPGRLLDHLQHTTVSISASCSIKVDERSKYLKLDLNRN